MKDDTAGCEMPGCEMIENLPDVDVPIEGVRGKLLQGADRQVVFFDIDPGNRRGHIASRLAGFVRLSFGPERGQLERGLARLRELIAG